MAYIQKTRDKAYWEKLCGRFLPHEAEGSVWRYSRTRADGDPSQGWKLHISATVLNACSIFEKAAPFLVAQGVQFKGPRTLRELSRLNSGLTYGYSQVGKFITVYPATTDQALFIGKKLHELTDGFISPAIPFDEQFTPGSCVYYRYGAFRSINEVREDGRVESCITDARGKLVPDDRLKPVPAWLSDPFKKGPGKKGLVRKRKKTPLDTDYCVIKALAQRGKGGVYLALDLTREFPRPCVIKEGRRNGEVSWRGYDGHTLVKNEHRVLEELQQRYDWSPRVYSSFEIDGNYYLVIEHVEGKSLLEIMGSRRRRFTIKPVAGLCMKIAELIEELHREGWVWNDCKPANLIVTAGNQLRPIDFEGANRIGQPDTFGWKTPEFSMSDREFQNCPDNSRDDLYSLGAVAYFLLTGKLFEPTTPVPIGKLRKKVDAAMLDAVNDLILPGNGRNYPSASETRKRFESILRGPGLSETGTLS